MEVRCKTCRFFVNGQVMGGCRRYPAMQNKHEMDWCGEHQLRETVSVQVYDIVSDETETKEVLLRKKPGRKPKNADSSVA